MRDAISVAGMASTMAPLTKLDVKLDDPEYVNPADATCKPDTTPFFLSNIDQMMGFTVETLYFYAVNPEKPNDKVAETLKAALAQLLVHYDFSAGRVRLNEQLGRMEIDRNYAGAQFGTAQCELSLADLGDVAQPNPLFRKFVPQAHNAITIADVPLMMIQVTTLKCGGHVIGFGMSHIVWDGCGMVEFLFNLMSVARGRPLRLQPKSDRAMLQARDPPTPMFHHPECYLPATSGSAPESTAFTTTAAAKSKFVGLAASAKHVTKVIHFTEEDLATLKTRALEGGSVTKVTAFEALSGHVWQARTRAIDAEPTQPTQFLYSVDFRDRMAPPLPRGFVGNAIYWACARATCEEVCNKPLSFCVHQIQQANERVTNDYIRSGIDWWEVYRGLPAAPNGIFTISWQKMPMSSIDFGWGKPVFAGPAVTPMVEFLGILPTPKQDGGLNVFLALQPDVMAKFQEYSKVSASLFGRSFNVFNVNHLPSNL